MAVEKQDGGTATSTGRRMLVGTNVVVVTLIVVGIVVVAQLSAYDSARWDMTSSGVNSLSEGTENLLRSLDQHVRLTSLYFETDREDEDQQRYRRAAQNLLDLYEGTNRGKVTADWVNPLKDHEKFQKLVARLRDKSAYKDTIAAYQARIDAYKNDLDTQMRRLIQEELNLIGPTVGAMGESARQSPLPQVEELLRRLSNELEMTREQVDAVTTTANQQD